VEERSVWNQSFIFLCAKTLVKHTHTHTKCRELHAALLIFTSLAPELEGLALHTRGFIKAIFICYIVHNGLQWDPMLFGQLLFHIPHKKIK